MKFNALSIKFQFSKKSQKKVTLPLRFSNISCNDFFCYTNSNIKFNPLFLYLFLKTVTSKKFVKGSKERL